MRSVFYSHLVNGPFGDPALYVRLAHRGEALLFDCGDLHPLGTRELLRLRAVFVSHAHIDHLAGFEALLRAFLYRETPLALFGPPGLAERIGHRLAGYTWNLVDGYPFTLLVQEWGEESGPAVRFRAANGFRAEALGDRPCPSGLLWESAAGRVRAVPLDHGDIPSLAFVLEEPLHVAIHKEALVAAGFLPGPWLTRFKDLLRQGAPATTCCRVPLAGGGERRLPIGELRHGIAHTERGMKIAYVTDAAPSPANLERIAALAADAHLLVIEATFAHAELARAQERNHLTALLAGSLARRARAARLLVFHHSPRYLEQPSLLAEEARGAFAGER